MNPILLLHGALGSKLQLEPLKKLLETKGRTVYSINFSGHSGKPVEQEEFGIELFAQDVFEFMKRESIEEVDIFGYSMGGYVALWFAHLHPQRAGKLITLGTKYDWSPQSAEKETSKLDPENILLKVPAFARILEHRHAPNDWKELLGKTKTMMISLGNNPLLNKENLNLINHPTTILLGDEDDMADRDFSKKVAAWLPKGKFKLLESTPHPIEKVNLDRLVSLI
jgi:pimeloyl-ACP methyl ester carboxylesterase